MPRKIEPKKERVIKRSKVFLLYYEDCETELLKILTDYDMTYADLSRATGVNYRTIKDLAYGTMSPVYARTGEIKPSARKICDYFYMEVADVFPRYFCSIQNRFFKEAYENIPYSTYSERVSNEDFVIEKVYHNELLQRIKKHLSPREYEIFIYCALKDYTFVEISSLYGFTCSRGEQIYKKILRKIRKLINVWIKYKPYIQKTYSQEQVVKLKAEKKISFEDRQLEIKRKFEKQIAEFDAKLATIEEKEKYIKELNEKNLRDKALRDKHITITKIRLRREQKEKDEKRYMNMQELREREEIKKQEQAHKKGFLQKIIDFFQ